MTPRNGSHWLYEAEFSFGSRSAALAVAREQARCEPDWEYSIAKLGPVTARVKKGRG